MKQVRPAREGGVHDDLMTPQDCHDQATDEARDECRFHQKDSESFLVLYQRYWRPVYAYLYARLNSVADAEDITSVVFEKAWTHRESFRGAGDFKSWLFSIVRHALVDHYRGRRPTLEGTQDSAEPEADPASSPEAQVLLTEQWRVIQQLLHELPAEQQEVLALRYISGLPFRSIARALGKREPAVKMTAYRALKELRRRYPHGLPQDRD